MASIWNPDGTIVPGVNADLTVMYQEFTATASQTVFNLTTFVFQPTTNSLFVLVNGVDQVLTQDYLEGAGGNSITFTSGLEVGDQVIIRGFIGSIASQTAAASANAAAISAASASTGAATATTEAAIAVAAANSVSLVTISTTNLLIAQGNTNLVVGINQQWTAGQPVIIASTANVANYMFGQITAYTPATGAMTVNVSLVGGAGTFASWNVAIAGTQGPDSYVTVAVNGGTTDALTAAILNIRTVDKQIISVVSTGANVTVAPTLKLNTDAAYTITMHGGQPLLPGSIGPLGFTGLFEFNAANSRWELLNPAIVPIHGGASTPAATTSNIVLTATSAKVQRITTNAAYLSVQLPDATTLKDIGGPEFVIANIGSNIFFLTDASGNILCQVAASQYIVVLLASNATVAGIWSVGNITPGATALINTTPITAGPTALGSTAGYLEDCWYLGNNQVLVVWNGTNMYASVVTLSGTTFTEGSILTVGAGFTNAGTGQMLQPVPNTPNTFVYCNATDTGTVGAVVLTVAGTVVSAGAMATIATTGSSSWPAFAMLSSTEGIALFENASTGQFNVIAVPFAVAGTVITPGAPVNITAPGGTTEQGIAIAALTATTALLLWADSNTYLNGTIATVSAGVLTAPAGTNLSGTALRYRPVAYGISATEVIYGYQDETTGCYVAFITISGSVITENAGLLMTSATGEVPWGFVPSGTVGQLYFYHRLDGNPVTCTTLNVSGGSPVNLGSVTLATAPVGGYNHTGVAVINPHYFFYARCQGGSPYYPQGYIEIVTSGSVAE